MQFTPSSPPLRQKKLKIDWRGEVFGTTMWKKIEKSSIMSSESWYIKQVCSYIYIIYEYKDILYV